jgi:adenosylcobinamide kinase/adenosylcobinamide-phosphate guanylyltransferase
VNPFLALVGGGVRSGKSAFALSRARALGRRRVFIATAEACDDEMRERVIRHREERGDSFATVEAPFALEEAVERVRDADVVVIDCLTLWMSNRLVRGETEEQVARAVEGLARALAAAPFAAVVVTNEVGMGVVPESALGRVFRDVSGRAHQRLARSATEIYFAALGCIVRLRPPPLSLEAAP